MNFRLLTGLVFIFFLLANCEKDPVKTKNSPPQLTKLVVPDTLFYNWDESNIVTIRCEDSDGIENIDSVYYQILTMTDQKNSSGRFYNDGDYSAHGDITPNNNSFATRLNQMMPAGNYIIEAESIDFSGEKSNTMQDTFFIKMAIFNFAPTISAHFITDSVYIDQIQPFKIQVQVTDPDSGDFVNQVHYEIQNPSLTQISEQGLLLDDGTQGDDVAGDNIFSIETSSTFASWNYGIFHLFIEATDNQQKKSRTFYKLIYPAKKELGVPPQILDLIAPQIINIPSNGIDSALIKIKALDSDNNRDIRSVYFNSYKPPDSTLSESSPLYLYDDGNSAGYSGDTEAGDNIYSIEIYIPAGSAAGVYRFEFEAIDYSNLKSNKIIHRLTLVETK